MRPIKLSMTAFGPFIATETVDFELFGERPLFLINGATGAGKTTILDAMCFALYGQTTGKEREAGQMRCDFADDNTITSVEFTFELASIQFRILRVPEQTRAKKSGEGITTQKARAELWQVNGEGEKTEKLLVPEKVTEATQKIEELTGLRVDQFRQVMVLPQGQFRRLLMADSKDREQIFSQLFETGIYKKIEDKLKQLASKVESSVRTLKNEQDGVLQTVSVEKIEALEQAIIERVTEEKAAATLKTTKESNYLTALKALDAAKRLDEDFLKLTQLSAEYKSLQQQSDAIGAKQRRLDLVDQALKIKPIFTELERVKADLKSVSEEAAIAEKKLQLSGDLVKKTTLDLDKSKTLEKEKDQLKQRIELLKSYRQRASKVQLAEDELTQSTVIHRKSVATLETETKRLEQVQVEIKQSEAEKKRLEQLLIKQVEVAAQAEKLQQAVKIRQRYDTLFTNQAKLAAELSIITKVGQHAADIMEQKDKQRQKLELVWHSGQAAILAKQLKLDQPCMVCGSLEHPSPAQAHIELPTDVQRESALEKFEVAKAKWLKAREDYSSLKSSLESLEPQLNDLMAQLGEFANQTLPALKQRHERLVVELQRMQKSRQQVAELDKQLDVFKQSFASAEVQLKQIQKQFNESQIHLQIRKTELDTAQQELPKEYRQSGKLAVDIEATETRLTRLIEQIDASQQAHIEADKQHSKAEAHLQGLNVRQKKLQQNTDTSTKQWRCMLEKSVFATESAFIQADLSAEEQMQLKTEVEVFKAKLQTLTGAIQEREKSLAGKKHPDLGVLRLAVDKATEQKSQAEHEWQQLDKHLNRLQEAKKSFDKLATKQQAYEQEYKSIGTLSNVANGNTGNKISLQRFVLGVLLDDVLLAASSRLTRMSKGRYNLIRKEDRAKGNKASGLEMEVEDTYTGKVRAVSTLSGGESFLASLSLALGLSDVVQAYAGGIRLETLFIDEGFGSLDSDTLDLAIKTLIDLRNTGRMVGIISHVSELKEQISMRLDVVSERKGSRIELVY